MNHGLGIFNAEGSDPKYRGQIFQVKVLRPGKWNSIKVPDRSWSPAERHPTSIHSDPIAA